MLKKLILCASAVIFSTQISAQTLNEIPVGFKNITELGVSKNFAKFNGTYSYGIQTVNGFQFNQRIFTGLGVGFERTEGAGHIMPVFGDVRVYLGKNNIRPFVDQTVGFTFHLFAPEFTETFNTKGFYTTNTSFGLAIPVKFAQFLNVSFGHRLLYRKIKFTFDERSFSTHFVTLKAGVTF